MKTRSAVVAALCLAACGTTTAVNYAVAIAPAAATVTAGKTLQLGEASKGEVVWSVQEANGGAVSSTGLYTAPATPGTFHVVATSAKDPKKSAAATVTVVPAPQKPLLTAPRLLTTGKTGSASAAAQDGVTFHWAVFGGALAGADTGAAISFTAADPGEAVLGCTAVNAAGDASPEAAAVVAILAPAATPVISAPAVLTAGRVGMVATVPAQPGVTFRWTAGNGAITSGADTSAIVFTAGTAGVMTLSVTASNAALDAAPPGTAAIELRPTGLEFTAGGLGGPGNLDGVGAAARFNAPFGIAAAPDGTAFVADSANSTIRKIAPDGTVTTLAGQPGAAAFSDGTGLAAAFNLPTGLARNPVTGELYVADQNNNRVRGVTPEGVVRTVSGTGEFGSVDGDGLTATHYWPQAVAASTDGGELWVYDDATNALRKITPNPDGGQSPLVTTVNGSAGGPCCSSSLALLPNGSVLIGQGTQSDVEVFDGGFLQALAGLRGVSGYADGPGSAARFGVVGGIAFDPASSAIYAGDSPNGVLRRLDLDASVDQWVVSRAAGSPQDAGPEDGTADTARIGQVRGIAALGDGGLVFTDTDHDTVRRLAGGLVTTLAGKAEQSARVDAPGASARFETPRGVAVGPDGFAYVADAEYVRRVAPNGDVTTFAGEGVVINGAPQPRDGLAGTARFTNLTGLAWDQTNGILYVIDSGQGLVQPTLRAITWEPAFGAEVVTTVAGGFGRNCDESNNSNALNAGLCDPTAVTVDPQGHIYLAENADPSLIRRLDRYPDGGGFSLTTVVSGFCDSLGAPGSLCDVRGLAADAQGNVYFADRRASIVRKLAQNDAGVWNTTDVAGLGGGACASADGESLDAGFCGPAGLVLDGRGALWVADTGNSAVRKLTPNAGAQTWAVRTVGGKSGSVGVRPGPLPGSLNTPYALALTPTGDFAVVDSVEHSLLLLRTDESALAPAVVQGR